MQRADIFTSKTVEPTGVTGRANPKFSRTNPKDFRIGSIIMNDYQIGSIAILENQKSIGLIQSKINRAIATSFPNQLSSMEISLSNVNRAIAQSRPCGILFASANGKLYFEVLKIFSVPENHLLLQRVKTLPKSAFLN